MTFSATKTRLILVPFIVIALVIIGGFTAYNWIYGIKDGSFRLDTKTVYYLIPILLPAVPVLLWLRPRLKYLNVRKTGKNDPVVNMLMFAWIVISASTGFAQAFLLTSAGKLTDINRPSDLLGRPLTKYYIIKNFYADKRFMLYKTDARVTGKHSQNYDVTLYVSMPLFDRFVKDIMLYKSSRDIAMRSLPQNLLALNDGRPTHGLAGDPSDTSYQFIYVKPPGSTVIYGDKGRNGVINILSHNWNAADLSEHMGLGRQVWLCLKFSTTIDNDLPKLAKEMAYKDFITNCNNKLRDTDFEGTKYFDKIPLSTDHDNYAELIIPAAARDVNDPIMLSPVNDDVNDRYGSGLYWCLTIFIIGISIFFFWINSYDLLTRHEPFDKHAFGR